MNTLSFGILDVRRLRKRSSVRTTHHERLLLQWMAANRNEIKPGSNSLLPIGRKYLFQKFQRNITLSQTKMVALTDIFCDEFFMEFFYHMCHFLTSWKTFSSNFNGIYFTFIHPNFIQYSLVIDTSSISQSDTESFTKILWPFDVSFKMIMKFKLNCSTVKSNFGVTTNSGSGEFDIVTHILMDAGTWIWKLIWSALLAEGLEISFIKLLGPCLDMQHVKCCTKQLLTWYNNINRF